MKTRSYKQLKIRHWFGLTPTGFTKNQERNKRQQAAYRPGPAATPKQQPRARKLKRLTHRATAKLAKGTANEC